MSKISSASAALALVMAAVCCSCRCPQPRTEARSAAAARPPAGLPPGRVPQFVAFGSDDNGYSGLTGSGGAGGLHFLTELFAAGSNPAGSGDPLTFDGAVPHYSFYVNTFYLAADEAGPSVYAGRLENPYYVRRGWQEALDHGHEIGVHTHSHPHGGEFSPGQWREEIQRCIDWLGRPFPAGETAEEPERQAGLGVSRERLAGFRTPFLEYNDAVLETVQRMGFRYDCSLEEGTEPGQDGRNFPWPYRLDRGRSAQPQRIASHPGLWEIPVYVFIVPPDEECARYGVAPGLRAEMKRRQDYFDPAAGKITGMDWNLWCEFSATPAEFLAILRYTLDLRLGGNRCPLTVGLHSELYSDKDDSEGLNSTAAERRAALREFFGYVLRLHLARVVDHEELLDWLQRPRPLPLEPK